MPVSYAISLRHAAYDMSRAVRTLPHGHEVVTSQVLDLNGLLGWNCCQDENSIVNRKLFIDK